MKRSETSTVKVKSDHGSHYAHISHVEGDIIDVRISSPGKFHDTAIGKLLEDIGDAIGAEMRMIHTHWRKTQ